MYFKRIVSLMIVLVLAITEIAFATESEPMKLWEVDVDRTFWREHPEIEHEDIFYDPWADLVLGVEETSPDVILVRLYNDEIQPLKNAKMMADLSGSATISEAVARMPEWIQQLAKSDEGQIVLLPVTTLIRPFYWYQDAWDAAGLTEADIPQSYSELLGFLDKWVDRIEENPEKNVCVSRLVRWNTGTEKYNYMYWLMDLLLTSHEMQQRYAGDKVSFYTPEFIELAEHTRTTGLALYKAEPRQKKRSEMLQLFQNDIHGGEHANNGREYGLSHSVPLRITNDQPKLTLASVEVAFIREGSSYFNEGILVLESLMNKEWFYQYALYSNFIPGDHPYKNSNRTGHVDAGWLNDYHNYDGHFVTYPSAFERTRDGSIVKEGLMMEFFSGKITSEEFAQKLDEAIR